MKKMLPIGSVVILKKAVKKIMITGYFQIDFNRKEKVYDYCGCLFPEGMIDKHAFLFDHDDIDKILYAGYYNDESKSFINKLEKIKNSTINSKILKENIDKK